MTKIFIDAIETGVDGNVGTEEISVVFVKRRVGPDDRDDGGQEKHRASSDLGVDELLNR